MKVKLKSVTPNAEVNIVEIARVSSARKDKTEQPEGLINHLIKNHHWSPFEHSYMTVEIETTKAIGIQLLRHRSFTFQEFSQRYAKVNAIEEIELREQAQKNRQSSTETVGKINVDEKGWDYEGDYNHPAYKSIVKASDALVRIQEAYDEMLEAGVARECARMILPMATQTTIYMTGPVRSWIHFIKLREDGHAQKEAQIIAKLIRGIFTKEFPLISKALGYE